MSLKNFATIIVSSPRCGSHLLASMISEGGLECEVEPLNPYSNQFDPQLRVVKTEKGWEMLLEGAVRAKYRGFIVQRSAEHGTVSFWKALSSYEGPICFLHRRNMLAAVVSRLLARDKTNPWWTRECSPSVGTLTLKKDEVEKLIQHYREESLSRIRDLCGSEVYPFVYEDFEKTYGEYPAFIRLAESLRLDVDSAKPRTYKQESRALSEVIMNWEEVMDWDSMGILDVSDVEGAMEIWR